MSIYERDITNTSVRLRKKAIEAIMKERRPLAVQEIKEYIRISDKELWDEVSEKCNDYIRVILSMTKSTVFAKYKSKTPVQGIDRRSSYYGLASETYPEGQWERFKARGNKKDEDQKEEQKQIPKNPPTNLFAAQQEQQAQMFANHDDESLFVWKKELQNDE